MLPSSVQNLFFISILSSIISAAIFTHSYSQCLDRQKSLLLELKSELIFDSSFSGKLVQWNQSDDCCEWLGVECDGAGHVISLQLDDEGISGGIGNSSTLFRLEYLEKLNLAYNDFNHTEIPRGIHNLSYLTHLNLSDAHFGGQVPLELSSLRRLVSLDISTGGWYVGPLKLEFPNLEMLLHNLTGLRELYLDTVDISSQKSEWSIVISSSLPNLRNLSLRYCGLSGPLDTSLSHLHSLSLLRLDHNNLSTPVPDFFASFSSLTTLSLYNCSLKGTLPHMIFRAPRLQHLDLSDNQQLSGAITPFTETASFMSIDLSFCNFTGLIPSTFANLTQLVSLDLSYNFFTGSLSSTIFTGLSNLAYLNLRDNSFTGRIPQSLFALPSLHSLSLQGNQFTGQVEEFPIINASKLFDLDLSSNQLEGPIPHSLFQLQGLGYLTLSNNIFSGIFQLEKFQSLSNIQRLELSHNNLSVDTKNVNSSSYYPQLVELGLASCKLHEFPDFIKHSDVGALDLSNNRIAGNIPNWFWGVGTQLYVNLSSNLLTGLQKPFHISALLIVLDLSSNQLQGELYLPISQLHVFDPILGRHPTSYLLFLSLANNSLSGSIPTSLCNATQIKVLDLSHNKLSGNIPPCLLQNTEIEAFNIGRNNISGHIPDSFSPNSSLISFDINNNAFEGKIPKSLQSCKSLEFMNVANNFINDGFPCMLSSSLHVLVLHSNRFHGKVTCHMNWPDLQIVDISSNNFTGTLESINFSSWKALGSDGLLRHNRSATTYLKVSSYVDYRNVVTLNIKGMQLELVKIWPDFTAIDFSGNNFHGEIPDAIGDLVSLYLLNLSHNGLSDTIPKSFGNLTQLGSLDLSMNQLTGTIPKELARLTSLSMLNLSYNKLVGVIPNGPQFQTFSADSFQGNSELCGFPLNISCNNSGGNNDLSPTGNENVQSSKREIEWEYVSAALGYVVGLGSIVWLLLFCRGFRERYFLKIEEVVEEMVDGRKRRRRRARRRRVENQGRRQ